MKNLKNRPGVESWVRNGMKNGGSNGMENGVGMV